MIPKSWLRFLAIQTIFLFGLSLFVLEVEARRGGGGRGGRGGGFSRRGPASGGSFRKAPSGHRPSFSSRGPASGGSFSHSRPSISKPPSRPEKPGAIPGRPVTLPGKPGTLPGKPGRPGKPPEKPPEWRPGGPPEGRPSRPPDHLGGHPHGRPPVPPPRYPLPPGYHYHWDDRWGWGFAAGAASALTIGAVLSASDFADQPCTPTTVVVEGVTYYRCDSTWYTRAYQGGDVTYVVVGPPPGY
jgi:hypothetical protein